MNSLTAAIRQALRGLLAQPVWTIAALVCLAIGTGANMAAFRVINGVLLRSLPFDEPQQVVMIAIRWSNDRQAGPVSLEQFRQVNAAAGDLFQQLAVRTFLPIGLSSSHGPARMVQAEFVSGDYFRLLRLRPMAGRFPTTDAEMVISEKLWRTQFHSDFSVVGKTVRANGRPLVISGVAPAGFVGAMRIVAADVWLTSSKYGLLAAPETPLEAETRPVFGLIGRLMPGVSLTQTKERLDVVLKHTAQSGADPSAVIEVATGFGVPPGLRPAVMTGSAMLFGLMGLLVAVAIANVAGLMLARATGRTKETAVRLALGASRARIVRQVFTESVLLAVCGAGLGAVIAAVLPSLLSSLGPNLPEHISFAVDLRADWRTGVYAMISAIAIAMLFGLAPARKASRTDSNLALRESAGNSRTRATSRTLNLFVTGQVAISTVLLVVAILLVRTFLNMQAVDPGIDIRNTLAVSVDWSQTGSDRVQGRAFFEHLLSRVSTMPGVERAALTQQPPLSPMAGSAMVSTNASGTFAVGTSVITNGYFDTVRLPLLQGRNFGVFDTGGRRVAIINETMARQLWPARSALGQTFAAGDGRLEVIGVVKDAKYRSLSETPRAVFYQTFGQTYSSQMTLIVRSSGDPRQLVEPIRQEIRSQNQDLADITIRTLEDQFRESTAPSRQRAWILAGVSVIGLVLSAFGLFGVMSYGVRQRVRELGVRIAVGARPANIALLVVRQTLQLVGTGFAVGVTIALAVTRLLASVLFGVSAHDPVTLSIVALVLGAAALAATYLPVHWAIRVDPMLSIRTE